MDVGSFSNFTAAIHLASAVCIIVRNPSCCYAYYQAVEKRTSFTILLLLYSWCLPSSVCESAEQKQQICQTCFFFHCPIICIAAGRIPHNYADSGDEMNCCREIRKRANIHPLTTIVHSFSNLTRAIHLASASVVCIIKSALKSESALACISFFSFSILAANSAASLSLFCASCILEDIRGISERKVHSNMKITEV